MAPPPPDVLRVFVALVPSEATTTGLADEAARVARADPAAHAVERESLHLTLVFLGATHATAIPRIVSALGACVAGLPPVRLRPVGLSAFPSPRAPRVVFAELAPDTHRALALLSARVAEALAAVGHGPDRAETFHPHVTLARMGSRPSGGLTPAAASPAGPSGARSRGGRARAAEGPSPALGRLLTAGTLQGTYIDDMVTDVRLLSSEPVPDSGAKAPHAARSPRSAGRRYRVLASLPLGSSPLVSPPIVPPPIVSPPIQGIRIGARPSAPAERS